MELNDIKLLSKIANLHLDEKRVELLKPVLISWIKDANDLSLKMSQREHLTLSPINIFNHPQSIIKNDN